MCVRPTIVLCVLMIACGEGEAPSSSPVATEPPPVHVAPRGPSQLALSDNESCLIDGARVVCWGRGAPPHVEPSLAGSIALGGTGSLLCALDASRAVGCLRAPLGIATIEGASPYDVFVVSQVTSVAESAFFESGSAALLDLTSTFVAAAVVASCSLHTEGFVTCGDPDHPLRIDDVRDLAFRDTSLCVITSDAIECGTLTARRAHGPIERIEGAGSAERIAAGSEHVCVIDAGRVRCAGSNRFGELGQGDRAPVSGLVEVPGPTDVIEIAASGHHTCARSAEATWCWGADGRSQSSGERHELARVDLAPATALFGGPTQTWALADGRPWAWGEGKGGQLGDGLALAQPVPVEPSLPGIAGITEIAAGRESTCVLYGGHVACFGARAWGGGETQPSTLAAIDDATHIAGVGRTLVVAHADRRVDAFTMSSGGPSEGRGSLPSVRAPADVVQLVAGDATACARTSNGHVYCWGSDYGGEVGDGGDGVVEEPTRVISAVPMPPAGEARDRLHESCAGRSCGGPMSGVRFIAGNDRTNCAVLATGRVACWGADDAGRFADGVSFARRPVLVEGVEHAQAACVGEDHLCALREDGTVICRGTGPAGAPSESAVAQLDEGVELSCGAHHACARRADGSVMCWGADQGGTLGSSSLLRTRAARITMPR